ncbi:MAG TPA: amidohydrolase [Candidatus Coprocola pullicola]|nr:amidohydrolase [Candidatus Coprocola pullicola]
MLFSHCNILLSNGEILEDAYLQVTDDKITYIGDKKPQTTTDTIYDGTNKLLLPGFVNTHSHVPMTLLRSVGADLPLDRWLNDAIFPMEDKLNKDWAYSGTLLGIAEMLRSGITSFSDMYFFGEARATAVLETGINANLSMGILCFDDSSFEKAPMVQETKDLFYTYHNANGGQVKVDVGLHAEYTSNAKIVKAVGEYAKEIGANVHIHLSETKKETQECIARHGKTPTAYFHDLGLFDNITTAAHCVWLTQQDREILAKKNVFVSHCPISNLKLGSGLADMASLAQEGVKISIGTDGVASNDNLNFLEDVKLSAMLQKGLHQDPSLFSAKQTLQMATKNGALAQNRTNTGALTLGNQADIVVVDYYSLNLLPKTDMLSSLIYAALPSDIKMTMVNGKILYQNGEFTTIDIEKVMHEVDRIGKKLY